LLLSSTELLLELVELVGLLDEWHSTKGAHCKHTFACGAGGVLPRSFAYKQWWANALAYVNSGFVEFSGAMVSVQKHLCIR
jgi:hypothetical protein